MLGIPAFGNTRTLYAITCNAPKFVEFCCQSYWFIWNYSRPFPILLDRVFTKKWVAKSHDCVEESLLSVAKATDFSKFGFLFQNEATNATVFSSTFLRKTSWCQHNTDKGQQVWVYNPIRLADVQATSSIGNWQNSLHSKLGRISGDEANKLRTTWYCQKRGGQASFEHLFEIKHFS